MNAFGDCFNKKFSSAETFYTNATPGERVIHKLRDKKILFLWKTIFFHRANFLDCASRISAPSILSRV